MSSTPTPGAPDFTDPLDPDEEPIVWDELLGDDPVAPAYPWQGGGPAAGGPGSPVTPPAPPGPPAPPPPPPAPPRVRPWTPPQAASGAPRQPADPGDPAETPVSIVPGGVTHSSWLTRRLARIGGMRADLVDQFPSERRDFAQMAVILFVTALEACLSGAFAINMALSKPVPPHMMENGQLSELTFAGPEVWICVVCGLVWAFMIFNIDRYMVIGMEGLHGRRLIAPFLIRGLLAVLIGLVMSTPLVLQIFDAEVKQEMVNIQAENASKQAQGVEKLRVQLRVLEDAVVQRQIELDSAKAGLNLEANPTYQDANKAYVAAQKDCDEKSRLAGLEAIGQLPPPQGSGKHGDGRVYQALVEARDAACRIKTEKKNALDKLVTSLQTESEAGRAAKIKSAQEALDAAIASAEHMRTTLKTSGDFAQASSAGAWGLLTRLQALDRVTSPVRPRASEPTSSASPSPSSSPSAVAGAAPAAEATESNRLGSMGHLAILFLLASIEVLPVLFKTFKQAQPERTPYEQRWRAVDEGVVARAAAVDEYTLGALRLQAYQPLDRGLHLTEQQARVGRHITNELVGVQLQIMQRALEEWALEHGVDYTPTPFDPSNPPAGRAWWEDIDADPTPPAAADDDPADDDLGATAPGDEWDEN